MNDLTPDKVKVYDILMNMAIKLLLVLVAITVFIVLFCLFVKSVQHENYRQAAAYGTTDGLFAFIIIKVFNHYFGGTATTTKD